MRSASILHQPAGICKGRSGLKSRACEIPAPPTCPDESPSVRPEALEGGTGGRRCAEAPSVLPEPVVGAALVVALPSPPPPLSFRAQRSGERNLKSMPPTPWRDPQPTQTVPFALREIEAPRPSPSFRPPSRNPEWLCTIVVAPSPQPAIPTPQPVIPAPEPESRMVVHHRRGPLPARPFVPGLALACPFPQGRARPFVLREIEGGTDGRRAFD